MTVSCDCCGRTFSDLNHFSQHIWAKNPQSQRCLHYFSRKEERAANLEQPAQKKRRLMRQRREAIIRGSVELLEKLKSNESTVESNDGSNDSVFDFDETEAEPEVTRPRVNPVATSRVQTMRNATAESEEDEGQGLLNYEEPALNEEEMNVTEVEDAASATLEGEEGPSGCQVRSFREYVERSHREYAQFSTQMKTGIELMHVINTKGGSLEMYEEVSKWHVENSDAIGHVSAERLHNHLIERYNLGGLLPKERSVFLPSSKVEVSLATHCIKASIADLLTDPRVDDESYLFFNDDPTAGPPDEMDKVSDINTGNAYRETYKKLIAPEPMTRCGRRKVLLPFIFYLDGCVTGHYSSLGMEILKFTIGLFKGSVRNKDWAWRNLGMIKKVVPRKKQAEDNIRESGHVDADNILPDKNYRRGRIAQVEGPTPDFDSTECEDKRPSRKRKPKPKPPTIKPQDFHKMMQVLLSGYKELEEQGGFEWDLWYENKLHKIWFVPFIIFFKADSVEADKLCGLYGSKTEGVGCVCRVCTCPTKDCSNPYLHPAPARKSPEMIKDLVRREEHLKLKEMSQHPIWNAMCEFRFGLHDDAGIHGAVPWEVLHFLRLNWFKNCRDCLFDQTGNSTALTRQLDALTITIGNLLKRQSDRTLPRTMFNNGVREGMLQAHHMSGVILVLALCLRCTKGRQLLLQTARGPQKTFFSDETKVRDWSRLLESMLMFECWLDKDEYDPAMLRRARTKLKEIMCMMKTVGQRSKGMGDNRGVFHALVHLAQMIEDFGGPKWFDTEYNEKDHKKDKKSAKRTQLRLDTFDMQVALKIIQRIAVELAMFELKTGRRKWHYYRRIDNFIETDSESDDEDASPQLMGTEIRYDEDPETGEFIPKVTTRSVDKNKYKYDDQLNEVLQELAGDLKLGGKSLHTYGILKVPAPNSKKKHQLYHAEPYNQGSPWHDWGLFEWHHDNGEPRLVLGHMKCFVDLRELPSNNPMNLEPDIYICIEMATPHPEPDEHMKSDLFEPWVKQETELPDYADTHNEIHLLQITNLRAPALVVPDLANENKRAYLRMVPKWQWEKMFEDWLELPHRREWD